ncbi:MAG TPA: ABC transporter ATP-binding protein/permease [Metalysinibacillus jejuensis]|uniref:ABC transporter ATP-binding protein/permease n=1 Tax=Metalysinibacillus jejuensis TaxID=914327 RepID=A0A921T5L0_9BACL|nr:ABC transporter ATP-binding protein/permease [Metalysinibacillus jejuensis]
MKTVFAYAKPYKWFAGIAIALMLFELFVELIQPLIMAKIIDEGVMVKDVSTIYEWALILLVLTIVTFIAGVVNSYFSAHVAQSFAFDLRSALFAKIQSFTMATYIKYPTSALITRLTNDVGNVQQVLFMLLRIMLRAPLAIIGSFIMAFYVNAKLAAILLISAPLLAIFLFVMVTKGIQLFSKVQKSLDGVNRKLQENLQAIRLVKAYMRGEYETKRFAEIASNLKIDSMKAMRTMEYIQPILLFVMNVSMLGIIWFGASFVGAGDMKLGEAVAVINYTMRITMIFSMFVFIIILFARAKASAERMEEVLVVNEGVEYSGDNTHVINGDIGFHDVSFRYSETTPYVLQDVSFTVKAGEKLAILGATGSGKSTLLQLLLRFYEPTKGKITLANQDIATLDITALRQMIGYVPQQSILFSGSIEENILWGQEHASTNKAVGAAKQAQIHESITAFDDGYATVVGQKGVNLSGGQKQRLSIARALVRQAPILILDDSTSALDVKTEQALWQALEAQRATMFVVTQKIQTAKGADKIAVLEEGRLVALGTHDTLLQTNELYQQIAASQQEVAR